MSADDPDASLLFAVANHKTYGLQNAWTFSQIGLDLLASVGREDLWVNKEKMFEFATARNLMQDVAGWPNSDRSMSLDLAQLAISRKAFIQRPTKWIYVEAIPEEIESLAFSTLPAESPPSPEGRRAYLAYHP